MVTAMGCGGAGDEPCVHCLDLGCLGFEGEVCAPIEDILGRSHEFMDEGGGDG